MRRAALMLTCLGLLLAACDPKERPAGNEIAISWEVIDNLRDGDAPSRSRLVLANQGSDSLEGKGWTLYFDSVVPIVRSADPAVEVAHVNGPFYRLSPTDAFVPIAPGQSAAYELEGGWAAIKRSDAPSGFYFVFADRPETPESVRSVSVGAFLRDEQTTRGPVDNLPVPTPRSRFESNRGLVRLPYERVEKVLPTPLASTTGGRRVKIDPGWKIRYQGALESEAGYLAAALEELIGARLPVASSTASEATVISLRVVSRLEVDGQGRRTGDEAYRLTVSSREGVRIEGTDAAGVFYGIQTLRALAPPEAFGQVQDSLVIDEATVEDAPRFAYRGMHLDVARNFKPVEFVEKLLEVMAFYKLNRFNLHLSDDEGWRFAVAALPELTEVGARRGHTEDELDCLIPSYGSGPDPTSSGGTGHYTRRQLVEILRYATVRHIEVMPEIDLPGHARAAIKSMDARREVLSAAGRGQEAEQYALSDPGDASRYRTAQGWTDNVVDVCRESTYAFIETVVDEIVSVYAEAGAPLSAIHVGGDEVPEGAWQGSERCRETAASLAAGVGLRDYFLDRVRRILEDRELATAGWEEIALDAVDRPGGAGPRLQVYAWNSVRGWGGEQNAYRLANAGVPVVLSNASNLYFDLAYDKDPQEPGLYWAGFVDTRAPFRFDPYDVYRSGDVDPMGNPVDTEDRGRLTALTDAGKAEILGIQGQLWGELTPDAASAEYMAFPKLLALAERAWARRPQWVGIEEISARADALAADWNRFANALGQRELPRLDRLAGGVGYRIPPPGLVVDGGRLMANTAFPGLTIRYTTDGSDPTLESPAYDRPVAISGPVAARVFDSRGRGSRVSRLAP